MPNHYNVLIPRTYIKDGAEKTAFTKVGVAFPMKGKDGFSITLEALPLQSIGQSGRLECKLILMPPMDKEEQSPTQEKKSEKLNDSIPF